MIPDSVSFGHYVRAVVLKLSEYHWHEYQNALLICDDAPLLMNALHESFLNGNTVDQAAELVNMLHVRTNR